MFSSWSRYLMLKCLAIPELNLQFPEFSLYKWNSCICDYGKRYFFSMFACNGKLHLYNGQKWWFFPKSCIMFGFFSMKRFSVLMFLCCHRQKQQFFEGMTSIVIFQPNRNFKLTITDRGNRVQNMLLRFQKRWETGLVVPFLWRRCLTRRIA